MKQKRIYSLFFWLPGTLLLIASACLPGTNLRASNNHPSILTPAKSFEDGKKPSKKEKSFRNQNVVKVFPDVIGKSVHVVARSGNEKDIDFLVFDLNGTMVLNYKMKAGEKKAIKHLKRGTYMYHVFSDDEYLTTGKIEFK